MTGPDGLEEPFDDNVSLAASLEDFEAQERRSPLFELPSQNSGFRSEVPQSDADDSSVSSTPWSPPGFKSRPLPRHAHSWSPRQGVFNRFPRLQPSISPSRSRQTSPEYQSLPDQLKEEDEEDEVDIASRIPLPAGTDSPYKERSPEPEEPPIRDSIMDAFDEPPDKNKPTSTSSSTQSNANFIRFAMRAEVQHREPFTPLFTYLRTKYASITKTKTSTLFSILVALLSVTTLRLLLQPPAPPPIPDLLKLTTLARSFEPLIFYSENGYSQITTLQETSVAVWDLGESVRQSNMTSSPQIVSTLDSLSDTLKTLGLELTRFFADVDSDIDSILLVMDWARRELSSLSSTSFNTPTLSTQLFDHVHTLLTTHPLLTSSTLSPLSTTLSQLLGPSTTQRTRTTITRTFTEFLNVLEDAISSELSHSVALFALFETIDRQFLNLQRSVVRETDTQEKLESELLSTLWSRLTGPNQTLLKKYERNKQLLSEVRGRTLGNKQLLIGHHGRLQTLKVNLETLRKKLVSPLVRREDSGLVSLASVQGTVELVERQVKGIGEGYEFLSNVRERQRERLLEMVYGAGNNKGGRGIGGTVREIEGR